jgi:ribonuclease-3
VDKNVVAKYKDFAKQKLGLEFDDINLLVTALTHRSYVNEHRKSTKEHNERLEFLGDAVLELVVTDFLYKNYSEPEGVLTNWRAALVRTESIGAAGESLDYMSLIRMSRGEKRGSERSHQQIVANCFEAVIGAVYLDKGYQAAEKFITDTILVKLEGILAESSWRDPKSYLQELMQRAEGLTPNYKVLSEVGPDHDKVFTTGVYAGDKLVGKGEGPSKQASQQQAATVAVEKYQAVDPAPSG